MVMLLPGNVRQRLSRLRIDDHRVRAPRNVETPILRIHCDVVPAAVTANVKCFFHGPPGLRKHWSAKRTQDECHHRDNEYFPNAHEILRGILPGKNTISTRCQPNM